MNSIGSGQGCVSFSRSGVRQVCFALARLPLQLSFLFPIVIVRHRAAQTRTAVTQHTVEDLLDPATRKNIFQQIFTVTNRLSCSVAKKLKTRQVLEAMVHQIEAETADAGENAGGAHPGRIL